MHSIFNRMFKPSPSLDAGKTTGGVFDIAPAPTDRHSRSLRVHKRTIRPIVVIIASLLATIWSVIAVSIRNAERSETAGLYSRIMQEAAIFSAQATRSIKNVEATVDFVAYALSQDPSPDRLKTLLDANVISMDTVVQIAHVDNESRTVSTQLGPDPNRTLLKDREHIRVHLEGLVDGVFISKPVKGRVSGLWSIQVTKKIRGMNGETKGVVVGSMDPYYFQRFWRDHLILEGVELELIGDDGVIRSRSHALGDYLERPRVFKNLHRSEEIAIDKTDYNEKRIISVHRLVDHPLYVKASIPVFHLDEQLRRANKPLIYVGMASTLALLMLGVSLLASSHRLQESGNDALRSRLMLEDAIDTMPNGFAYFDSYGRMLISNKAFRTMFPDLFAINRSSGISLFIAQSSGLFGAAPIPSSATLNALEETTFRRDESWIQARFRRTREDGLVATWTDISEVKKQEEDASNKNAILERQADQLIAFAEEARKTGDAKAAFLATMSHEIRTPLHAILGFTDVLWDKQELDNNILSIIRSSGKHLLAIVNDILDFSEISSGRMKLHLEAFNLLDLARDVSSISAQLPAKDDVDFRLTLEPESPVWVIGDRRRLMQCLLNLTSNSLKFTDTGHIEMIVQVSDHTPSSKAVTLKVRDTGVGIGEAALSEVMEPFGKENSRGSAVRGGAGLGLPITQKLVELMNGSFSINSRSGEGTECTISLQLPVATPLHPALEPKTGHGPEAPAPLNILLVEDVDSARCFARLVIQQMGHNVVECENGAVAVQLASEFCFDVVLMDLQMPVMDGLSATRRIRELPEPLCHTKIIALTAQALDSEVEAALRAGVDSVISKPFNKVSLSYVLKRDDEANRQGNFA